VGWRAQTVSPTTRKRAVVFRLRNGFLDMPVDVPCGQCLGCRVAKAREWALRCYHEAQLFPESYFVTLSYADAPESLDRGEAQRWLKRVRKTLGRFRYFLCGEYGHRRSRPHYHALLFGITLPDLEAWSGSGDRRLYRSAALEATWPLGHSWVGTVTPASARYVAGYVTKKLRRGEDYGDKVPEFALQSLKPGLGAWWFDQFGKEAMTRGFVIDGYGNKQPVPDYYVRRASEDDRRRIKVMKKRYAENLGISDARGARALAKETCLARELSRKAESSVFG